MNIGIDKIIVTEEIINYRIIIMNIVIYYSHILDKKYNFVTIKY